MKKIVIFLASILSLEASEPLNRAVYQGDRELFEAEIQTLPVLRSEKKRELLNLLDYIIEQERQKPWYTRTRPLLRTIAGASLFLIGLRTLWAAELNYIYKDMPLSKYSLFDNPFGANLWAFFAGESTIQAEQTRAPNTAVITAAGICIACGGLLLKSSLHKLFGLSDRYANALAMKAIMHNAKEATESASASLDNRKRR